MDTMDGLSELEDYSVVKKTWRWGGVHNNTNSIHLWYNMKVKHSAKKIDSIATSILFYITMACPREEPE